MGQDLALAETQLRDYEAKLGKPFVHQQYLAGLTDLQDQLKAGLSAAAQAHQDEKPTVAELAEQMKALKASHTIEAAPQRASSRTIGAEEPVTARIRRKAEATAKQVEPATFQERLAPSAPLTIGL